MHDPARPLGMLVEASRRPCDSFVVRGPIVPMSRVSSVLPGARTTRDGRAPARTAGSACPSLGSPPSATGSSPPCRPTASPPRRPPSGRSSWSSGRSSTDPTGRSWPATPSRTAWSRCSPRWRRARLWRSDRRPRGLGRPSDRPRAAAPPPRAGPDARRRPARARGRAARRVRAQRRAQRAVAVNSVAVTRPLHGPRGSRAVLAPYRGRRVVLERITLAFAARRARRHGRRHARHRAPPPPNFAVPGPRVAGAAPTDAESCLSPALGPARRLRACSSRRR